MVVVEDGRSVSFIEPLVVIFRLLSGAVDPAEIPASLESGRDDPRGDMAVEKKLNGRRDEKAIEEEGSEG